MVVVVRAARSKDHLVPVVEVTESVFISPANEQRSDNTRVLSPDDVSEVVAGFRTLHKWQLERGQ